MKTKVIIVSIFITFFSANIFAKKQSAAGFVESFYKFQRARSGDFTTAEMNAYKRWFTDDLNKLFENELKREKEHLKQNPIDKPFFGDGLPFEPLDECYKMGTFYKHLYKLGAPTKVGNKTTIEISFSNPKVCGGDFLDTYKVELVKNKGVWQINDVIYSDGKRLSDDLKRTEY